MLGYYSLTKTRPIYQGSPRPQGEHAPTGVDNTGRERTPPPKGTVISLEPKAPADTYNQRVKSTPSGPGNSLPGRSPPFYEMITGSWAKGFPTAAM
jgi:hypothetical protein